MNDVESFINSISSGSTADLNAAFNQIMTAKISAALDAKKIELANSVYNGVGTEEGKNINAEVQDTTTESE